jgi:hypothetical protein
MVAAAFPRQRLLKLHEPDSRERKRNGADQDQIELAKISMPGAMRPVSAGIRGLSW